tara:strand:+ start:1036 stop:1524 length:489 start_codon:yes stop_codon:yes gene_type:complete
MNARASVCDQIKVLDKRLAPIARANPTVQLFMTAPGLGIITALSVVSAFDDASRFKRSSSAGAYLGLTPRRYESGETSRNGRISKQGDKMDLYEAATTLLTRNLRSSPLKIWGMKLAKVSGFKKSAHCGRPKTCCGSSRNVENRHAIPLDTVGSMIWDKLHD